MNSIINIINPLMILIVLTPLLGFILGIFIPDKRENLISKLAICSTSFQFIITLILFIVWAITGFRVMNMTEITLYQNAGYHFFVDFLLDKNSMAFLMIGSFLSLMVTIFSQYYMHREDGYKRFFNTILLFYFGYNLTVLSGNFETLFLGWEVLGVSSFLLIAFYRYRYLPVRNSVKIFTIYRLGDVGILLAMWLSHHFWHENVTFLKMTEVGLFNEHIHQHSILGFIIGIGVLLAASAKSAQFPFSFWLPRAMEGPTPSSAIFYGSLSVHMGVFLLLRTYPLIANQLTVKICLFLVGAFTFIVAMGISRVQSSIKAQVAYSSIAHIGLMFVEISLGLQTIAIFHFVGNALLRTYQLLISPSIVAYKIREQFYTFTPEQKTIENFLPKKLSYGLYVLSLKEWNLDSLMYLYTWAPAKWIGRKLSFLTWKNSIFFIPICIAVAFASHYLDLHYHIHLLPEFFGVLALVLALKSFSEKNSIYQAFVLIAINHFLIATAVFFNEHLEWYELVIYVSGIILCTLLGLIALRYMERKGERMDLSRFHGHAYEYPKVSILFFVACLGLTGFPISPTFLGEDLMFSHIHETQFVLVLTVSFSYVVGGLSLIRMYAKSFLGPHSKNYHEIAYRSS